MAACPTSWCQSVTMDRVVLVLFLVVGFATRFIWLDYPAEVVFDETHFGKFTNSYCCSHEYFFDIHPPFTKLLFAYYARVVGYHGQQPFEKISEIFQDDAAQRLRILPAFAGSILPAIMYRTMRDMRLSIVTSSLGALLVLFDHAIAIESRLILTDSLLFLFCQLSFWMYWRSGRFQSYSLSGENYDGERNGDDVAVRVVRDPWWYVELFVSGLLFGAALSTKWVASLATFGICGVHQAISIFARLYRHHTHRRNLKKQLTAGSSATCTSQSSASCPSLLTYYITLLWEVALKLFMWVAIPTVIYVGCWYLHEYELSAGSVGLRIVGDQLASKGRAALQSLEGLVQYTIDMNVFMYTTSSNMLTPHHWQSWYTEWPLVKRGVMYWYYDWPDKTVSRIYIIGNPWSWWSITAVLGVTALYLSFHFLRKILWVPIRYVVSRKNKSSAAASNSNSATAVAASTAAAPTKACTKTDTDVCTKSCCAWDERRPSHSHLLFITLFGWVANMAPFYPVERSCFIYHYIPALLYGIMHLGLWVERWWSRPRVPEWMRISAYVWFYLLMFHTAYFLPYVYGFRLTSEEWVRRRWLPGWD